MTIQSMQLADTVEYQGVRIEIRQHARVYADNQVVPLRPNEVNLLKVLMAQPGKVVTHRMLLAALYGEQLKTPDLKIINVMVCYIRKKLSDAHPIAGAALRTIWGRGYMLGETLPPGSGKPDHLPPFDTRWITGCKLSLVREVLAERVRIADLLVWYPDLTEAEFSEWQRVFLQHGLEGLRSTKVQLFR